MTYEWTVGDDLPDLPVEWKEDGVLIDFSSGWTFELKVGSPGSAAAFTKTSGFTGAATSPNLVIQFATSGELNTLAAGRYTAQLRATRTSDSRTRTRKFPLSIGQAIS